MSYFFGGKKSNARTGFFLMQIKIINLMSLSKLGPDIKLNPIVGSIDEYNQISHLYLNPEITRWIRNGNPWDKSKILRYLEHFRNSDYRYSGFVDYKIIINNVVVGIVGFRPDFIPSTGRTPAEKKDYRFYLGRPFISILVDPNHQGKGYARRALEMGMKEYNELYPTQVDFYSYISLKNKASIGVHEKVGFKELHQIGDHTLMGYSLSPERNLLDYDRTTGVVLSRGQSFRKTLIGLIMNKSIPFPYARNFLPHPETMMENYREKFPEISNSPYKGFKSYHSRNSLFMPPVFYSNLSESGEDSGNYMSILSDHYPDYENINGLTDHFIEDIRIRARKVDRAISTAECYGVEQKGDEGCVGQIVNHVFKFFPSYEDRNLRDSVFSISRDPGLFKIMWVKGLLNILIQDKINREHRCRMLDISSGWGDRLIGAIAHQCQYLGFDPNTELKDGHDRIIETFGDTKYHKVIYSPFEEADLSNELPFDICITSPPFFGIEIYSEDVNQSINKYPNFLDWITGFLFKSLEKVWEKLNYGGCLAIHMGDVMNHNINEPMLLFIEQFLPGSSYHGVIGVGGDGAIAPVWIWRKMKNPRYWKDPRQSVKNDDPYGGRHLDKLYPEIYERYYQRSNSVVLSENETMSIVNKMNILSPSSLSVSSRIKKEYSFHPIEKVYSELDPISQVCLVKDTFSAEVKDLGVDSFVDKITFSLSDDERTIIELDIKSADREDFKPDRSIVDIDKFSQLKEMTDYLDVKRLTGKGNEVLIAERLTNPFANIGNSIFTKSQKISNEAIQLANVDSVFNFCQRSGGLLGPQEIGPIDEWIQIYIDDEENKISSCSRKPKITGNTESLTYPEPPIISQKNRITSPISLTDNRKPLILPVREMGMKYCDINPMTSGFSEYIAYRFPPDFSMGIGIYSDPTAKDENSPWHLMGDEYYEILGLSHRSLNASKNNNNGIIMEVNDLASIINENLGNLDLVVGSSIVHGNTLDTFFMLNSILMISSLTLKEKGSLVCKIPCVSNAPFAELIYIASMAFERIGIMKPVSTDPTDGERYLVCNHPRQSKIDICIRSFTEINKSYSGFKENGLTPVKILKDHTIPQRYFDFLKRQNDSVVDLRIRSHTNIIEYLRGNEVILPEYELSRTLLTWNLPDNAKRTNILDFVIEKEVKMERKDNDETLRSRDNSPYLARSPYGSLSPGRRPASPPRIALQHSRDQV